MAYHTNRSSHTASTYDEYRDYDHDYDRSYDRDGYEAYDRPRQNEADPRAGRGYYNNYHRSTARSRSPRGAYSSDRSRGNYYDRDAPQDRSRSRTPPERERFVTRDVIIEGFGGELTDDDIMRELAEELRLTGIEKVTLIRDRKTGLSRGFAFVRFVTTDDSAAFVDTFGPSIRIGEDRCRIAFSRERDEGDRQRRRNEEGEEWKCRVCLLVNYPRRQECFRCQTPRSEVTLTGTLTHPTPTYFTNDGQRDMATSSTPSQFLLFRSLEAGVNEDILSKGVYKLSSASSPAGAAESSIRRVLLVRDRRTNESWRFGFAEFSTPQEAQKALKVYEGLEKFTISSKPVSVSYIHPGVFVPVYNAPEEAERFTFLPLMPVGGGMRLAYWDEEAYVSELVLNTSPEPSSGGEADKPKDEKKSKKRKAEPIAAEKAKKPAVPAPHLQFWQNRHSELHGVKPKPIIQPEDSNVDNSAPEAVAASMPVLPVQPTDDSSRTESFADMNKLACLLCSRQFKTAEKLHQHERVSPLHADNLKKPELVETARKKLPKKNDEYRDRAKERREAFGPGTAPAPSHKKKQREKTPVKEVAEPVASKGAALLGKMGWSAGQGLGASGEGRTEHVVAEMYTAGVGLGMKGAKVGDVEEVAKAGSGGYGDFVRRTKERAKERYEEMG
ncbi:hypothetical protein BZA77DRAFT_323690 [Pyronema omphalodes]|nr:hypothetical protein BZA77DRAFT_323690 [Pyronema omphalodes]